MMLLKLLYQLGFATAVLGWNHASRKKFEEVVRKNEIVLVAFVAPWTEPSKALELEWELAAGKSKKPLISIDCTKDTKLCEENEVISYPSIRLYKSGESVVRYRGPRKASAIVPFIDRSSLPPVSILHKANLTSFRTVDEAVFIAYTSAEVDLSPVFSRLASRNNDRFSFATADASLSQAEKIPAGCVLCYKGQEEPQAWCGHSKLEVLEQFVEKSTAPLISEMTSRNEMKFLSSGKSIVYYFFTDEKERSEYAISLKELAKTYQEYLSFVTIDAVKYGDMAINLGLQPGEFPALVVQNVMLGQTFPYDQRRKITVQGVETFVLDISQGKVQPASDGPRVAHTEL